MLSACLLLAGRCWFSCVCCDQITDLQFVVTRLLHRDICKNGREFQFAVYRELVMLWWQCKAGSVQRAGVYMNC
jgi:hypothetical protein